MADQPSPVSPSPTPAASPISKLFGNLNKTITWLGLSGTGLLIGLTVWLQYMCSSSPCHEGSPIAMLMIAAGAFAVGAVVGLVLTAGTDEKEIFGSMSTAINGVIGGFTIADLSRKESSAIVGGLRALAAAANLPGIGLISAVVVFFGALGFVAMFVNRQYLLKPAMAGELAELRKKDVEYRKQEDQRRSLQELVDVIQGVHRIKVEPGDAAFEQPAGTEEERRQREDEMKRLGEVVEKFKAALTSPELFQALPLETLRAYAKAHILLGQYDDAERILGKARSMSPDNVALVYELARLFLIRGRYAEAASHLSFLTHLPSARIGNYKLLGYACLFIPGRLDEAEDACRKYLAIHPDDAGAKLNLACALGQRGPQNMKRGEAIQLLREVLKEHPGAGPFVASLAQGEGDFNLWAGDGEFNEAIKPFKTS